MDATAAGSGGQEAQVDTKLGSERRAIPGSVAAGWPALTRGLSAALVLGSLALLGAWLLLAAVHVDDRYKLDHVSGARMALAQYYNHGTLYPKLYDGSFYGGTRFMPLPIVLHGALASVTGEYLVSGKLLSYGAMVVLLGVVFAVLRGMRCPLPIAIGLIATIVGTRTGLAAGMDMRADTLPLLLQVLALAIVARSKRPAPIVVAAALAALALFCKLNAVWAPLAICVWLLVTDRRLLAWFIAASGFLVGGLAALFAAVTDGRIFQNVVGLSAAGVQGPGSVLRAPYFLLQLLVEQATGAWVLLLAAAVAGWLAVQERRATIWLVALVCCVGVLLVVLSDVGTGWNQLIDLVVLAVLVAGQLVGRSWPGVAAGTVPAVAALVLLWVNLGALAVTVVPDLQPALASLRGAASDTYSRQPLAGRATQATRLLSEDPYVPVSLGQRPVVLDPFMLLRIGRRDPAAVQRLADRIRAREFDLIVLVVPVQPVDRPWWREMHFGEDIAEAVADAYAPDGTVQGYYLYRPAAPPGGGTGG
jgi:hypothetical protein